MTANETADRPAGDRALVTAAEWFAGGRRVPYRPGSARILGEEASARPGVLRVFERVAARGRPADSVWPTMLPGFPDGSYGWAQVDRLLGTTWTAPRTGRRSSTMRRSSSASTARNARRWNLAVIAGELGGAVAITVAGSIEDPYEHRQIEVTRRRVPEAEVVTFPGGHLTTGEHPDLLASAVRDFAGRHGVGPPVAPRTDLPHNERKPA